MDFKIGKENADRIAIGLSIFFLILYVLFREPILGVLCAIFLVIAVVLEVAQGVRERGWKEELKDTVITIGAIVVVWLALSFALRTSSPLNAVVSCSMLPNLERGDLVVIYGEGIRAPEIEASEQDVARLSNANAVVEWEGKSEEVKGSALSACATESHEFCAYLFNYPSKVVEKRGNFEFHYGTCYRKGVKKGAKEGFVPCLQRIEYKDYIVIDNRGGDVVVYAPKPSDAFSRVGDIIHRAMLKIKTESNEYYIIKGDNNEIADIQIYSGFGGNSIVERSQIKGKVIARVPILGYLRLFLSGYVEEDPGCSYNLNIVAY
ncbi:MAG: hypothetical protein QW035_03535 [Candidatus Anstonellales archaeon]